MSSVRLEVVVVMKNNGSKSPFVIFDLTKQVLQSDSEPSVHVM